MQKLFRFIFRWSYRLFMLVAVVFVAGILADKQMELWVKVAATVLLLLMFTIPECFPNVFPKAPGKAMSGIEFERYCAKKLSRKGFRNIKMTPPSGDYGADLVATDWRGRKWVIQCKRYKGKVGNAAVQEIVAAKAHYRADRAAVMTNSQLTPNAKKLAVENDVVLFERIGD